MEKIHPVTYDIMPLLKRRWSPRAFADTPVSTASLCRIFEAGRWSASCFNEQPWRFITGCKGIGDTHARILATLSSKNQLWAATAPVLVLISCRETFTHNDKPNAWHQYDAGQSVVHMTVQAMSEGIYVHQMAGFSADKARESFAIPAGYLPRTAMAIGYPGDPERLPAELRAKELAAGTRRPLEELVFSDTWDHPADFLSDE